MSRLIMAMDGLAPGECKEVLVIEGGAEASRGVLTAEATTMEFDVAAGEAIVIRPFLPPSASDEG